MCIMGNRDLEIYGGVLFFLNRDGYVCHCRPVNFD